MEPAFGPRWRQIEVVLDQLSRVDAPARQAVLDRTGEMDPDLQTQVQLFLDRCGVDPVAASSRQYAAGLESEPLTDRMLADSTLVADRFRIVRFLGGGGMGEVYEVEDQELGSERMALKTLRASLAADERAVERLTRELQLARRISHPNVCRVHDVYRHRDASGGSLLFFTMELLTGESLADRLWHGVLEPRLALPIVRQIAAAIDAAHAANVAHGDLKPGNVILVPTGGEVDRAVVTDFGLSRWLPGSVPRSSDPESRAWGTPAYMAPEQLLAGTVTRATDIYALGVLLYELVTGMRPFAAESPLFLALKKLRRAPPSPRQHAARLDPRWEAAILRCLDVDPDKRFTSAVDVVRALDGRPGGRRWRLVAAVALVLAVLGGLIWGGDVATNRWSSARTWFAGAPAVGRTLAVLPFTADDEAADSVAFAQGLTAGATERLGPFSQPGRLHVVPPDQVFDTGVDTPAMVHQTLGADAIVTGHVETAGDRVVVTVALHEASESRFAERDRRVVEIRDDEGELQGRVAGAIGAMLGMPSPEVATASISPPRVGAERAYLRGRGHLLRGTTGLPSAIAALQQSLQEDGRYVDALTSSSVAYLREYDAKRESASVKHAEDMIERALALDPADAAARVVRARFYQVTGQHRRARAELERALELDPDVPDARNLLAHVHEAEGEMALAEQVHKAAIGRHPRYWLGYVDLGTFYYLRGRYREAEEHYVIGIGLAPANPRAILNLAAVYQIQDRFQAAEIELLKGLKISPDANLYNNLGWIYILEGRFQEAVSTLEQAVSQPGADSIIWSGLARARRWAGRPEAETRAAYARALALAQEELRLNPQDGSVRSNRAYLLAETGSPIEAEREIGAALGSSDGAVTPTVVFRSALVHELVGDRKAALNALERAATAGYPLSRIARDADLAKLRRDPGYQRVLNVVRQQANERQSKEE